MERRVRAPGVRCAKPAELVLGCALADLDHRGAADAEVPAAHGAGGLSPDAWARDLALDLLLARRLHAPVLPVLGVGALRHRDAGSRERERGRRAQLHARRLHRPRVQHGRRAEGRRAAARARGAAVVRRDDRFLGQRHVDNVDEQHPMLEVALGVRVLEQDAVERNLHADPRSGRVQRPEPRDDSLRRRGVGHAGSDRAQFLQDE